MNRVASILHALASTAAISRVCEKKTTFSFCCLIKDRKIDSDLVKKVGCIFKQLSFLVLKVAVTVWSLYIAWSQPDLEPSSTMSTVAMVASHGKDHEISGILKFSGISGKVLEF